MNKEKVLANILYSFVDSGECKEQDFIQALIEFIPKQSSEQATAIYHLKKAITWLNEDEKISNGHKDPQVMAKQIEALQKIIDKKQGK